MQQSTTTFRPAQRSFPIKAWASEKRKFFTHWLSAESQFYTRLCEFSVSRLLVLQVHTVALCMFSAAFAVETHSLFTFCALAAAIALVAQINKQEKKGGTL